MALMSARYVVPVAALLVLAACAAGEGTVKADAPANRSMSKATKADPVDLVEVDRQAAAAYSNGDYEQAVPLYRTMVEAIPGEPEYWYRLGNALARTDHPNDAAIAYEQVLIRSPDNARAWHNLGVVRLLQAQASFAEGVKSGRAGDPVFDESLRLSTAVFDLTATDEQRDAARSTPTPSPATAD